MKLRPSITPLPAPLAFISLSVSLRDSLEELSDAKLSKLISVHSFVL